MTDGLSHKCRNAMIPEPLIIVTDADGNPQFLPEWEPPFRTWIDVHGLAYRGWIVIEAPLVKILFGEKTVVYERIGFGLHGEWICDLKSTAPIGAFPHASTG